MFSRSLRPSCKTLSLSPRTTRRSWTSLTRTPDSITVHALNNATFPYIWLRDSCRSPTSINPKTGHKLHCTSDIPLDIAPLAGEHGIKLTENDTLEVSWNDGHTSVFERGWLGTYSDPSAHRRFHFEESFAIQPWSRSSILASDTFVGFPYEKLLSSDEELLKAYAQVAKYGILFIRGVPTEETSDERCELKRLAERFGEMRKTFYGLVWDVVKLKDGNNVAFTNLGLRLHMDLLYFEHPPRYQILHCLRNRAIGGTSIAVDGILAAQRLRELYPADFDVLTKTPVTFHYIHDGHHIHQEHYTIELARPPPFASSSGTGGDPSSSPREISHINYSPPEQGPLPLSTPKEFYPALKKFTDLFKEEEYVLTYDLAEGDALIFDNRRLVHGRTAFRYMTEEERRMSLGGAGGGDELPDRWLKGCYLGADAVMDRVRVLKARFEKEGV